MVVSAAVLGVMAVTAKLIDITAVTTRKLCYSKDDRAMRAIK